MSNLDVIVIADCGVDSVSSSNPMKYNLAGRSADIQAIEDYVRNGGEFSDGSDSGTESSWSSAYKYNGLKILDHLLKNKLQAELINDLSIETEKFKQLLKQNPKLIVLSTTFILDRASLQRIHDEIRELSADIPLIVGGPFVYTSFLVSRQFDNDCYQIPEVKAQFLFQDEVDPDFDLFIINQAGEDSIAEALDCVANNRDFATVTNSMTIKDGVPVISACIDDTPPKFDSVDWQQLPDEIFASGVVSMQASRGCPFACAFCNFVKDIQMQAVRSVSSIIEDMKVVESRGGKYVWFVDDIFRLGHGNLDLFSREVIASGVNLQWMSFIRADTVKGIDFNLLREAGCIELQLGLESASPDVLQEMNKKANPDVYRVVIEKALRAGINISAYFIFGHPGETEESINRTIEFIKDSQHPELPGAFSWSFFPFLLVPLSPLFEREKRSEYDLQGYMHKWSHSSMNSDQAQQYIKKAFMSLTESGPIYRGDNLLVLGALPPQNRKQFYKLRHRYARLQHTETIMKADMIQEFKSVLNLTD